MKEEEDNEQISFLNLSLFIIDKNAFVDNSDVSKIYFFHHYQSHPTAWAYRWVHKPNDPVLLVPGKEYEVVEEQMQAFIGRVFSEKKRAAMNCRMMPSQVRSRISAVVQSKPC